MMNTRLLLLFMFISLFIHVKAENNPFHSDVLWVATPNHGNWLYRTGEKAACEVQLFHHGMPMDNISISYELGGDMMPSDSKGEVTLRNGRTQIEMGTMKSPGFRECVMTATIDGQKYSHHIKVGFSPEKLQPYTAMPTDFDQFWKEAREEDKKFPLTYSRNRLERLSTDKVDCFLIRLQLNRQNQGIYGYLFYPKSTQAGKHPVILTPPGAGIKEIKNPLKQKEYVEEGGFIRFEIDIHGLNPELDPTTFGEISAAFNSKENGYLSNGLDNRDNYYMRHVYLGCVRAIDLLTSLPEWDGKNVIVQGGSQGGALALITAGLDERVTACIANHPALSDMAGYKANRAGGYPHFFRNKGMDTPDKICTMAYYDVVNFAKRIKCPTYITWGYCDSTCPPTTSYIVYNVISAPKESLITPINEHWTSDRTGYKQFEWAKNQVIK